MESRSATTPPAKPRKYKGRLSSSRRKKPLGVGPLRTVPARVLEEPLEEYPRRRIVQLVMGQPSGGLARICAAAAPRAEMLHRSAQCRLLAHEAPALPVDDVDVRVDFRDAFFYRLAGTIAAEAVQPASRQAGYQRTLETIPWRRQHRQEGRTGKPLDPLARQG